MGEDMGGPRPARLPAGGEGTSHQASPPLPGAPGPSLPGAPGPGAEAAARTEGAGEGAGAREVGARTGEAGARAEEGPGASGLGMGGGFETVRIVSWNINGLPVTLKDAMAKHGSASAFFRRVLGADILCLQETKLQSERLEKWMACAEGYQSYWAFSKAKKGYSGVVTYVSERWCPWDAAADDIDQDNAFGSPFALDTGLASISSPAPGVPPAPQPRAPDTTPITRSTGPAPTPGAARSAEASSSRQPQAGQERGASLSSPSPSPLAQEGRVVRTDHGPFVLFNVYVPNGGERKAGRPRLPFKLAFLAALRREMDKVTESGRQVILVGDLNISHGDIDVFSQWKAREIYCPEELQWLDDLIGTPSDRKGAPGNSPLLTAPSSGPGSQAAATPAYGSPSPTGDGSAVEDHARAEGCLGAPADVAGSSETQQGNPDRLGVQGVASRIGGGREEETVGAADGGADRGTRGEGGAGASDGPGLESAEERIREAGVGPRAETAVRSGTAAEVTAATGTAAAETAPGGTAARGIAAGMIAAGMTAAAGTAAAGTAAGSIAAGWEGKRKDAGGRPWDAAGAPYVDLFRHFHPHARDVFTVWDQRTDARPRNEGQRMDYTICTRGLLPYVVSAEVMSTATTKAWSDHAPVALTLRLPLAQGPHPPQPGPGTDTGAESGTGTGVETGVGTGSGKDTSPGACEGRNAQGGAVGAETRAVEAEGGTAGAKMRAGEAEGGAVGAGVRAAEAGGGAVGSGVRREEAEGPQGSPLAGALWCPAPRPPASAPDLWLRCLSRFQDDPGQRKLTALFGRRTGAARAGLPGSGPEGTPETTPERVSERARERALERVPGRVLANAPERVLGRLRKREVERVPGSSPGLPEGAPNSSLDSVTVYLQDGAAGGAPGSSPVTGVGLAGVPAGVPEVAGERVERAPKTVPDFTRAQSPPTTVPSATDNSTVTSGVAAIGVPVGVPRGSAAGASKASPTRQQQQKGPGPVAEQGKRRAGQTPKGKGPSPKERKVDKGQALLTHFMKRKHVG